MSVYINSETRLFFSAGFYRSDKPADTRERKGKERKETKLEGTMKEKPCRRGPTFEPTDQPQSVFPHASASYHAAPNTNTSHQSR